MTQNHDDGANRKEDLEQIDFIDLVLQLWHGKWAIAAIVAQLDAC
ncbi:hypothetical protein [Pseudescherichia vulneris]|nr:hypothetical protein [Pseudescherichia vulneris]